MKLTWKGLRSVESRKGPNSSCHMLFTFVYSYRPVNQFYATVIMHLNQENNSLVKPESYILNWYDCVVLSLKGCPCISKSSCTRWDRKIEGKYACSVVFSMHAADWFVVMYICNSSCLYFKPVGHYRPLVSWGQGPVEYAHCSAVLVIKAKKYYLEFKAVKSCTKV